MNIIRKISKDLEIIICNVCLFIMLAVLTLQVVLRYVFNNSNSWSDELARYLFIWFIFVGAAYAAHHVAHIRIESLNNVFPKKIRKHVQLLGSIIWIIFCAAIVYISGKYTIDLYKGNQISLGLGVKMAYAYAAIPVGYTLIIIRVIQKEILTRNN